MDSKKIMLIGDEIATLTPANAIAYNNRLYYHYKHDKTYNIALYPVNDQDGQGKDVKYYSKLAFQLKCLSEKELAYLHEYLLSIESCIMVGVLPPPPCTGSKCEGGGG